MFNIKILKEELVSHGLYLKKRLGQNFLIDHNILGKLIESLELDSKDTIIEIGPGIGNITELIAAKVKKTIAIELDRGLCEIFKKRLSGVKNVELVNKDVLDVNIEELAGQSKVKIIGNLPYYITTPIIFHLLKYEASISSIFLTIQKEVAGRIVASPHTKEYGILSIGVGYYCKSQVRFKIPRNAFYPPPKVDSSFIELKVLERPQFNLKDEGLFFKIVKCAFNQRRKTLLNSLANNRSLNLTKGLLIDTLEKAHVNPSLRAEDLSIGDFANIVNLLAVKRQTLLTSLPFYGRV